jgi:hypothetical protein
LQLLSDCGTSIVILNTSSAVLQTSDNPEGGAERMSQGDHKKQSSGSEIGIDFSFSIVGDAGTGCIVSCNSNENKWFLYLCQLKKTMLNQLSSPSDI